MMTKTYVDDELVDILPYEPTANAFPGEDEEVADAEDLEDDEDEIELEDEDVDTEDEDVDYEDVEEDEEEL